MMKLIRTYFGSSHGLRGTARRLGITKIRVSCHLCLQNKTQHKIGMVYKNICNT